MCLAQMFKLERGQAPAVVLVEVVQLIVQEDRCRHAPRHRHRHCARAAGAVRLRNIIIIPKQLPPRLLSDDSLLGVLAVVK